MFQIKPLPRETVWGSLVINLTNQCNGGCSYCFQNSLPSIKHQIWLADVLRILDFFAVKQKQEGVQEKYLHLTGGEIFLHPDIFEIIRVALDFGYVLRLQTNGFMFGRMKEEKMKVFSDRRILIKMSLDGWDERTHEAYRQKGSFKRVLGGIRRLKQYTPNIGINTVIHDLNFQDLPKILDFYLVLGIRGFSYNILRPEGRGALLGIQEISEIDVIKKLLPYLLQNKYRHLLNGTKLLKYLSVLLSGSCVLEEQQIFYTDFNGDIYPRQVCRAEEKIGSVFGRFLDAEFDKNKLMIEKTVILPEVVETINKILERR